MNDGDTLSAVVMGFFVGVIATMALASFGITGTAIDVKNACEAELPRDQRCVIVAVPAEE